jgi:hypothetical protein
MELIVVALLIADWRRSKPISMPYAATLGFFATVHVLATPVANSPAFQKFAVWFASV